LTESRSFGYGLEDLISLHKVVVNESCLGPLKLMTSQVVQGTWLKKGGSGVNVLMSFLMSRHVNFVSVTIQMKAAEWFFAVVLFSVLYKVVLSFEYMVKIL